MRIYRKILVILGAFCLFFGIAPLLFGVRNVGVVGLLLLAAFFFALPHLWIKLEGKRIWRVLLACCITVGLLLTVGVSSAMLWQAYGRMPPDDQSIAVVVLGGGLVGTEPSMMLKYRLDAAMDYLNANPDAVCIVTGGQGADEIVSEASAMAAYLARNGIEAERVMLEDKSKNTRENLAFAKELLPDGCTEIAIATDAFHELRASIYAREQGLTAYSTPCKTPWGLFPAYWLREICGICAKLLGMER